MRPKRDHFHELVLEAVEARHALDGLNGRALVLGAKRPPEVAQLTAADWRAWEAARQRSDDAERALLDYVRRPIL